MRVKGGQAVPHAEDRGAASYIEDDLVLEKVTVLVYRVAVALGAHFIFLQSRRVSIALVARV